MTCFKNVLIYLHIAPEEVKVVANLGIQPTNKSCQMNNMSWLILFKN